MITVSSELLQSWVLGLLLPLSRVLGMLAMAPVLSHRSIPARIKIGLGVFITLAVMPTLPRMPAIDMLSLQGVLLLAQQLLIGAAIGFIMRLLFAAVDMAGQLIGLTMGLGFATFFDPQSQGQSNTLNQFFTLLAMLVFLSINGHLLMISAVVQSFAGIPISTTPSLGFEPLAIALMGREIFSAGLLMALPALAALLITNMALGILTRTAPQLNLFGIGFPITLTLGLVIIAVTLPGMLQPIQHLIDLGIRHASDLTGLKAALPGTP